MTEETWMSAETALENGFVTEVLTSKVEAEKVEEIQNFIQGQVFKNFSRFPTGMFKNLLQSKNQKPKIQNKIAVNTISPIINSLSVIFPIFSSSFAAHCGTASPSLISGG